MQIFKWDYIVTIKIFAKVWAHINDDIVTVKMFSKLEDFNHSLLIQANKTKNLFID